MGKKNRIGIIAALVVVLIVGSLTILKKTPQKEENLIRIQPDFYTTLYARAFMRKHHLGKYLESEEEQELAETTNFPRRHFPGMITPETRVVFRETSSHLIGYSISYGKSYAKKGAYYSKQNKK